MSELPEVASAVAAAETGATAAVPSPPPETGPRRRRRIGRLLARMALGMVLVLVALTGLAAWLDARYPPVLDRYLDRSTLVVDRDGRVLRGFTARDGIWRLAVDPAAVSPLYRDMLIAAEDRRFRAHAGVDPFALVRAMGQWLAHGRPVSGASTLTMQTARLLEPRPRTLWSKLIEMARAVQLEWHYTKDEILGIYLTLAPYGGNLEGVRMASLAWFGREPAQLSAAEAALLVALPQSPTRRRPDRHPEAARAARDRVLARLAASGTLTAAAAAEAAEEPVPAERHALPFVAPHLAETLVAQAGARGRGEVVATLIDGRLQRTLEDLARRGLDGQEAEANLAIVVVDNRSRAVIGYVGSSDYFAVRRGGPIDLARAVRSPGSALKPFIYGLGFEDRLIHPETVIQDVRLRFGDYSPVNFAHGFSGELTVREALRQSLNIPAVAVLDRIGPARLAARLRAAGAPLRLPPGADAPSLPIALGGAGTRLVDLVMLYTALANGGEAAPLRYRPSDPAVAEEAGEATGAPGAGESGAGPAVIPARLLDPVAAWYVTDILAGMGPPTAMLDRAAAPLGRRIAYKTGTSYGFRDAWAIGYDADHTVGVWVGRPDGSPRPDRYGRNTAAPLLYQVFDLLPAPRRDVVPPRPAGVLAATNAGLPSRLRRFTRTAFAPRPAPPGAAAEQPLRLQFPVDGSVVELSRRGGALDSLALVATGGQRPLRWLVNGRPLRASPARREAEWQPSGPGQVRIVVIDRTGAIDGASVWLR